MTDGWLLPCIIGALWAVDRLASILRERSHARERRELYSRLQAGTLTNYAAQVKKLQPEKQPRSQPPPEPEGDLGGGLFLDEKQAESVGAAGAAYTRLMAPGDTNES